jgi:hypothetical protein
MGGQRLMLGLYLGLIVLGLAYVFFTAVGHR